MILLPKVGPSILHNKSRPLQLSFGNKPSRFTLTASSISEANLLSGLVVYVCIQYFDKVKEMISFIRMITGYTDKQYDDMCFEDKQFYSYLILQYNLGSATLYYYLLK